MTAYRRDLLETELPHYTAKGTLNNECLQGKPVWLEIGFGNGEFLSTMCTTRPDIFFIGCEPFMNGVAALLADIKARVDNPVDNLRIWHDDARILIDALPDHSVDRVYLLNPDPWPKKRHIRRRFVQPESLDNLARILKPDGLFIMSTDVAELAEWMHMQTWAHPAFEWCARSKNDWLTPPADWPLDKTRYMKKALGGETIYWLIFKRL